MFLRSRRIRRIFPEGPVGIPALLPDPEETLEKIRLFRETGVQQDGLGLGIQNTIERIQLIYQNRGQLIFANAPDGGAVAELYLPVIIQEEER